MKGTNYITFCEKQMMEAVEYYLKQVVFKNDVGFKVAVIKSLNVENSYHIKLIESLDK